MANQSALTTPTLITNGEDVSASVTNRIVNNAGGLLTTVTALSGNLEVTSGNATVNIVGNRDVMILCNNTSNIVVNLPPASSQLVTKKIRIRKTQNNLATITVTRNGSDVIDNPFAPTGVPVSTTLILYLPGEEFEFISDGNVWRVGIISSSNYLTFAHVNRNLGVQNVTTSVASAMNNKVAGTDIFNWYNTSTFRYTPQVPGRYMVIASHTWNSGTFTAPITSVGLSSISEHLRLGSTGTDSFVTHSGGVIVTVNGTTDYLAIVVQSAISRSLQGGVTTQYAQFYLESRIS
jgi:hypothetical protein